MTSVSSLSGYGFNQPGFPSAPFSPFTGGNITYGGCSPSQPDFSVGSHFGLHSQCASPVFSEASPYAAAPSSFGDSTHRDIANFTAMTGVDPRMPSWDGASANTYTAPGSVPGRPYWESPTTTTAPYPLTNLMPDPSWYRVQQHTRAVSDVNTRLDAQDANPMFSPACYSSTGAGPWSPISLLSPKGSYRSSLESAGSSPLLQKFGTVAKWHTNNTAPNGSAAPTFSAPDHHCDSPRLDDSFTHYDPGPPVPDTSVTPGSVYLGSQSEQSFKPAPSRCSRFSYGSTVSDDSPPTYTRYSGMDPSHVIPDPQPSLVTTPDWIKQMERERDTGWGTRASIFVKNRMTETVRSVVSGLITQGAKHGIRPWGR